MKKLEGHYNHEVVEEGLYDTWNNNGYFKVKPNLSEKYSLFIPPPNVTGMLHLGHALDNSIQDAIIRYQRLLNKDVLYLPGMDHAGIATQARVMQNLKSQGVDTKIITRDEFLKKTWEWKDEYATNIHDQWKLLGLSLDYDFETFTLDPKMSKAVNRVFVDYYQKGLIYQGYRIINWDPVQQTALSNVEVIHQEIEGAFYYFKYYLENSNEYLLVATTRPETMFADKCLVINPKDKRYLKYHGKNVINPVNGEVLPILFDEYVDISFGTGVMKCTPAHDPNDYVLGLKYNLEMPICMNLDGTMKELALEFNHLDRFDCRTKLVEKMKKLGFLEKIEKVRHNVGFSERSNTIVEPYLSKQWFVKMRPLADKAIKLQQSANKIQFYPKRFEKTFLQWMENIEDWCISRQLWWGHQIPAYYHKETGELLVSEEPPVDIENYTQDPDVFDTWFSSGLWPFAPLGWPDQTKQLDRYFPNSTLVTGYDIIFFWVSRMITQSLQSTGKKPFDRVIIHGLVRDSQGQKMSKSRGNGIDPRDLIKKHGTDALRNYLLSAAQMGQDMNFNEEKVLESSRYFDKLFNATRYVEMQFEEGFNPLNEKVFPKQKFSYLDLAILTKLNSTIKKVKNHMNNYRLNLAIKELYNFVYDDFCSNYLEMSKIILQNENSSELAKTVTKNTLYYVLKDILIMLSPFAPFLSEHLYLTLPNVLDSINLETFPHGIKVQSGESLKLYDFNLQIIKEVRNLKSKYQISPKAEFPLDIYTDLGLPEEFINSLSRFLSAQVSVHSFESTNTDSEAILISTAFGRVYVKLPIDFTLIKAQLDQKIAQLQKEIVRSNQMLSNENFLKKAPAEKINEEKAKRAKYELELVNLEKERNDL